MKHLLPMALLVNATWTTQAFIFASLDLLSGSQFYIILGDDANLLI